MKFKKGQKVRIRTLRNLKRDPLVYKEGKSFCHRSYGGVMNEGMMNLCGKEGYIEMADCSDDFIKIKDIYYIWIGWMIEDSFLGMLKECLDE
jgi:hypothetical protein